MIFRSSRSPQKQETWIRQRCLWVTQYNFGACFANKLNMMMIFIRRANLAPCYVLFLSILRRRKVRRVPRARRITSRSWCHVLSLISNSAHTPGANIFVLFFSTSAPSRPNSFEITGIKVMISGIAFDRSDRLSPLRTFPYDRFKIYTIVPIVRMDGWNSTLSKRSRSTQSTGSFAIVWVAFPYDRFDRLYIIWRPTLGP